MFGYDCNASLWVFCLFTLLPEEIRESKTFNTFFDSLIVLIGSKSVGIRQG